MTGDDSTASRPGATGPTDCPMCDVEHDRGALECPGRRVGTVFNHKYELLRVLGCGGMGAVYEARHVELKRRCAVKVMLSSAAALAQVVARFKAEAQRVAALEHPGIVRIFDAGTDPSGTMFIEMELLSGESLEAWAERRPSPVACVDAIARALDGLAEAHAQGIIHRDIKPENIFVAKQRDGSTRIVVLDFGIARDTSDDTQRTASGSTMGTLLYMSPEQMLDASTVEPSADVYAMAATLYRLLVGRSPVDGTRAQVIKALMTGEYPKSVRASGANVSPALDAVIAEALAFDRAKRPRDASEFRAKLRAVPVVESGGAAAAAGSALAATEMGDAVSAVSAVTSRTSAAAAAAAPAAPTPTPTPAPEKTEPRSASRLPWIIGGVVVVGAAIAIPLAMRSSDRRESPVSNGSDGSGSAGAIASPPPAVVARTAPTADAAPAPPSSSQVRIAGGAVDLGVDRAAFDPWCAKRATAADCQKLLARIGAATTVPDVETFDLDRREVVRSDLAGWANDKLAAGTAKLVALADHSHQLVRVGDGKLLAVLDCDPGNGFEIAHDHVDVIANGMADTGAACVTFDGARAYCADHGSRLPTSPEWVLAASRRDGGALRDYTCADAVFGRRSDGKCKQLAEGPANTAGDTTVDGARDLAGDLSEWVDGDHPPRARGGNWASDPIQLHPATVMTPSELNISFAMTIGFRCARDVR